MNKYIYRFAVVLFVIGMLITIIDFHSFNPSYYQKMYEQEKVYETLNLPEKTVDDATIILLDYLKDTRQNIDFEFETGEEYYSQREKDHMVDVKNLYQSALLVRNIAVIVSGLALVVYFKKKDHCVLKDAMTWALSVLSVVFVGLGVFAYVDFDVFWQSFHELFFSNDLWLLDPAVDRMINMVPLPFFMGLVFRIIVSLALGILLMSLFYFYIRKKCYDDSRRIASN